MWEAVTVLNLVIATAYFGIFGVIASSLLRSGQLAQNHLGAATSLIFLSCGLHHMHHGVHMLLPFWGLEVEEGLALRQALDSWWHSTFFIDLFGAGVAIWYWRLRRTYAPLMQGAKLFDDMREREQRALEINDNIMQGLATIKMAAQMQQHALVEEAADKTLANTRAIIASLRGDAATDDCAPGSFRRESEALVVDGK